MNGAAWFAFGWACASAFLGLVLVVKFHPRSWWWFRRECLKVGSYGRACRQRRWHRGDCWVKP